MLDVDRFGNLELNVTAGGHRRRSASRHGDQVELGLALTPYYAVVAETYADASRGELILYEDSYGAWAIAINGGSAAALTETASATSPDPHGLASRASVPRRDGQMARRRT